MRPLPPSHCATSPQVNTAASLRLRPASERTETGARSNLARVAACSGVSRPRPSRQGCEAVRRMTPNKSAVRAPACR